MPTAAVVDAPALAAPEVTAAACIDMHLIQQIACKYTILGSALQGNMEQHCMQVAHPMVSILKILKCLVYKVLHP